MPSVRTLGRPWPLHRLPFLAVLFATAAIVVFPTHALAQLSKGHRILIERGLQIQGMVTKDDVFDLSTYQAANYTAINWLWDSSGSLELHHGPAPGFPWARWVSYNDRGLADPTKEHEQPYVSQLVALQLGDEHVNQIDINDAAFRQTMIDWFANVRPNFPNTILHHNNWGGQIGDAALADFVARAQPDMLSFDSYPFKADYDTGQPNAPAYGSPTNWYAEMRRYRVFAQNAGIPWGIYRQTFEAVENPPTRYRDPSPSEMNLNTFAGLAFGATTFIDFTYNTGASNIAPHGMPQQPGYDQQTNINRRARNLGKSLVHLTGKDNPLNGTLDGGPPTTDIMFLRGRTGPNNTDRTPVPIGFVVDPQAPNSNTDWVFQRNDPYMTGWVVTNLSTTKNVGLPGDVIISWFKPLQSNLDDPADADDQLYFMVTNAFAGPDGTAADYRQRITINFLSAVGESIQYLDSNTGEVALWNLPFAPTTQTRRQLIIELDGGEGMLFKFNTGDPFVGASVTADFDTDGDIDGADLLTWQRGLGAAGANPNQGDANADGAVDATDLATWKAQFTASPATPALSTIPEPAAWLLLSMSALLIRLSPRSSL